MPPSTAATVNQFPNPKVSDVEKGEKQRRAKGGICYSSLEWISPLLPSSPRFISASLAPFFFSSALFQAFISPRHFPSAAFWVPSKGFQWLRGGLSLQNVIPVKQGRCHPSCFSTPPPVCHLAAWVRARFWYFHTFDLRRKSTVVTSQTCHFILGGLKHN